MLLKCICTIVGAALWPSPRQVMLMRCRHCHAASLPSRREMAGAGCLCMQQRCSHIQRCCRLCCRVRFPTKVLVESSWRRGSYLCFLHAVLTSADFTLEEQTVDGDTALTLAAEADRVANVKMLLQHGASPHNTNGKNESPLLLGS